MTTQKMQPRAEITRANIVDAAREVFARSGYAGTSITDITTAAGASKGAVYFHFTSKAAIAEGVLSDWSASHRDRLARAAETGTSPLHQLVMVCHDTAATDSRQVEIRAALRLMIDLGDVDRADDLVRGVCAQWVAGFDTLIGRAVAEGQLIGRMGAPALSKVVCSALVGSVLSSAITGCRKQHERNMSQLMAGVLTSADPSVDTSDVLAARLPATSPG